MREECWSRAGDVPIDKMGPIARKRRSAGWGGQAAPEKAPSPGSWSDRSLPFFRFVWQANRNGRASGAKLKARCLGGGESRDESGASSGDSVARQVNKLGVKPRSNGGPERSEGSQPWRRVSASRYHWRHVSSADKMIR